MSTSRLSHKVIHTLPVTWQQHLSKFAQLSPYFAGKRLLLICCFALIPVIAGLQALLPLALEVLVNDGIMAKNHSTLMAYSSYFLLIHVFCTIATATQMLTSTYLIQSLIKKLRLRLISHIMNLKASYHEAKVSGNLLTRATSDFDNITHSLQHGVLISIVELFAIIGSIIAMFILDVRLAMIVLLILPIAIIAIYYITGKVGSASHNALKRLASYNAYTGEHMYQHLLVKLYGMEEMAKKGHNDHDRHYRHARLRVISLDALLYSFIEGVSSITIGMTMWFVMHSYFGLDDISPGVVVAFIQVLQFLFDPLKGLAGTMSALQEAFSSFDRIFSVLAVKEHVEGNEPLKPITTEDAIVFKDVSFSYENFTSPTEDLPTVLKNVSFSISKGTSCALVGATGSGKSTIAKLLIKLYGGYQGSITVGHQQLRDIAPQHLREKVALVSQDLTLFSGSVAFNISLGRKNITRNKVIEAAKLTGAHRFISQWPLGYEDNILERGANLSIGEKQLISLSRALCSDPELIILDEATASIDPKTEEDFERATSKIMGQKTILIIAHKLSTITHCDHIIVMEKGKIKEKGDHNSLMALNGAYAQFMAAKGRIQHHDNHSDT
ncbi:MAG: ABC transporter ATP-binding protein [Proteobacteria bacterium]|nr:ABC transporter ATP-binding protein [Pseudomonadota bacterium]